MKDPASATMHARTDSDVVVTALPAPHVYGNVVINSTFMAGGCVVLMRRFDPGEALRLIDRYRATLFEGVPAMYAMMLAERSRSSSMSSLTRCTVGGQTMAIGQMEEWENRSTAPLIELWGMTELAGLGTTHPHHISRVLGSIGVSLPGLEVRVVKAGEAEHVVAPGEPGELVVRGPLVMIGYHGNEEATREVIDQHGWLHTGDVAVSSDDGHFRIVDRLKDMIVSGGYNVYPAEIERVLSSHPSVELAAVGRIPDAIMGELPRAYVVCRAGAVVTEKDIINHCRAELAGYKVPRSVRFVADLPRTSSGKIMRRRLADFDQECDR